MSPARTRIPPARVWTAGQAFSWGMFGDAGQPVLSVRDNLPAARRSYDTARSELRDAIANSSVTARGFRKTGNHRSFMREELPSDAFDRFPSLTVDAFGESSVKHPTSPLNIPQWDGVIFEEGEIRALWPKPRPDLDEWMRTAATARPGDKKDAPVEDARMETGCTVREAQKAHGRLPPELKRRPGQRIKSRSDSK